MIGNLQFDRVSAAVGSTIQLNMQLPFFSVLVYDSIIFSDQFEWANPSNFFWNDQLFGRIDGDEFNKKGWEAQITFINHTDTAMGITSDALPGQTDDYIHITVSGPWSLRRSK